MKCDEIRTLLNPYVDRDLSTTDADRVKKHLGECPACAKEVAELKKVKEILHKMPVLTAPAGLLEGVSRNLARPNQEILQGRNTFLRYRWLTFSLVSTAAVILVVFTVMIQSRKSDIPAPAPVLVSEKAKANLKMSVTAKTGTLDAIQAQPMLFTQQINISARNVDNTVAKVYAVASTQTADPRLRAEYQKKQAVQEEFLAKAPAEQPIQDETQTISNAAVPLREKKVIQSRQLGQVVKISIPLSQKDAFIKQLQGNIPDKMILSEIQVVSPAGQQDRLSAGYLADAGKAMTEGEEPPDSKNEYDKMARGGGKGFDGKQAEANKTESAKSNKAKGEAAKDKSAEQTRPSPGTTTTMSPPPPPAAPAPSAPTTGIAASPPRPSGGFGQISTEKKEAVRQDKDMEKPGLVGDIKNDVSQASQPTQVEPEAMIEFIIVIEPSEK